MSMDGQGTCRRNIAENFNCLSRAHERYRQTTDRRQTTDGRAIAYSEREREFTFAKNPTNTARRVHTDVRVHRHTHNSSTVAISCMAAFFLVLL